MSVAANVPFPESDPPQAQTDAGDAFCGELPDAPAAVETCCFDVVDAFFDGPGDTTIRPVRDSLRPYLGKWPRPVLPPPDE